MFLRQALLAATISLLSFGNAAFCQDLKGTTLVHFTQGGAADRLAGYRELAKEFQEETGATIQFVEQPWEQMQTSIINDALSGTGNYDVIDVDSGWDGNVAPWLEPLDERIKIAGLDMSDYKGLNALVATSQGKRYGIPLTARSMVMFYRKDLLDAKGVPVPQTWEELIDAASKLSDKDIHGYVGAGVAIQQEKLFFSAYKGSEKTSLFTVDGKPTFDNQQGARAIQRLRKLFASAPKGVFAMDIPEADQVFLNGEAAFLIEWPDYIQPALNDPKRSKIVGKWAATVPPGPGNYASWYVGISSASHKKDAAWAWLRFIADAKSAKSLMMDHGLYATRNSVLLDPAISEKLPGMQAVVASASRSFHPSWLAAPWGMEWFVRSSELVSAGVTEQSTPEETVSQMAKLWTDLSTSQKPSAELKFADVSAE